jgi:hypothetical protein
MNVGFDASFMVVAAPAGMRRLSVVGGFVLLRLRL